MDTSHAVFLAIGVVIVLVVGRLMVYSGRRYVGDNAPGQRDSAGSAASLVAVLFHLLTLGLVALISVLPFGGDQQQAFLLRLGVLLIVLALVYGITLSLLSRRREENLAVEVETRRPYHRDHGNGATVRVEPREDYRSGYNDQPGYNDPMNPETGTATGQPDREHSL